MSARDSSFGDSDGGFEQRFAGLLIQTLTKLVTATSDNLRPILYQVVEDFGVFSRADRAYVFEIRHEPGDFGISLLWTADNVVPDDGEARHRLSGGEFSWLLQALVSGDEIILRKLDELPPQACSERSYCIRRGLKSFVMMPLRSGDTVIGTLGLDAIKQPRDWTRLECEQLRTVASVVALTLTRCRNEEALKRELEVERTRFREFLDHSGAVAFIKDEQGRHIYGNRVLLQRFSISADDFIGSTARDMFPLATAQRLEAEDETVRRTQMELNTGVWSDKFEGRVRRWQEIKFPIPGPNGEKLVGGLALDVTEREQSQRELSEMREMLRRLGGRNMAGEMVAAISHEINQPLCAIVTNAEAASQFLAAEPPDMAEAAEALLDVAEQGKRAGATIHRVRDLLESGAIDLVPLSVNELVREAVKLLEDEASAKNTTLKTELADDLPDCPGERISLQQVVINLVHNSFDAMASKPADTRVCTVRTRKDDSGVRVEVHDTGIGIQESNLEQLRRPFATTKPDGLGMGLAVSTSIIKAHGGELSAKNNASGGATFWFRLPFVEGADGG